MNNGKRANQSDIRGVLAHLGQTRQTAKRKISPVGGHFWRQWGRVERWNFFSFLVANFVTPQQLRCIVIRSLRYTQSSMQFLLLHCNDRCAEAMRI